MASPSIRGHQGVFKIFQDGALVDILAVTSVDVSMDSSFSRHFYVGSAVGEGDQTIEGWSGSFDVEVKDPRVDEFIDAIIASNLNGIGYSDYTFTTTENYADGTSKSYVYYGCLFKYSRSQKGLNDKITKRVDFQADGRKSL